MAIPWFELGTTDLERRLCSMVVNTTCQRVCQLFFSVHESYRQHIFLISPRPLNLARYDGPAYSAPSKFMAVFIFGSIEYCSYISKVYFQLASNSKVRIVLPVNHPMRIHMYETIQANTIRIVCIITIPVTSGYGGHWLPLRHHNPSLADLQTNNFTKKTSRQVFISKYIYLAQRCSEIGKRLGIKKVYVSNRAISNWSNEIVNFTTLFRFFCLYKTQNRTYVIICDKF